MCDLWTNTLDEVVPRGAVAAPDSDARSPTLPPARQIKLYNAGSFFDPQQIPPEDDEEIAREVEGLRPRDRRIASGVSLRRVRAIDAGASSRCSTAALEVAIGLETAHPGGARATEQADDARAFRRAAEFLRRHDIALRVFMLLSPPFMPAGEAVEWACRSIDLAAECGATACSVIPTRGGNGAMEALGDAFVPPRLPALEAVSSTVCRGPFGPAGMRVFADLWDIERFFSCDVLARARRAAGGDEPRAACRRSRWCVPVTLDADLAIVGSGFGGSILAMIARRLGYRVMLLERGRHPRFAIGESASPLAGVLIEQLADRYDLPRLRPLSAFGTWQRTYPEVVCGLKRGFTYFKHETGRRYAMAPDRSNQLLVAASPNDELSDTHWLRADVDHFLVREAIALGAEYLDEVTLDAVEWHADDTATLRGHATGQSGSRACRLRRGCQRSARVPQPGAGHRGARVRRLSADAGALSRISRTSRAATRCRTSTSTLAASHPAPARIPMDDAALHHVFDGGWMWVLRFGNGVTSAGIAVTDALAKELRLAEARRHGSGSGAVSRRSPRSSRTRGRSASSRGCRAGVSRVAGCGRGMGDAAVGGGIRRSAVLDRDSADVARHRADRGGMA